MTSRLWLDRPGRWRVETTADGGDATGILVRDGDRWDFEVVGSDEREGDPRESDGRLPLTLHAVVADMIDADRLLGLLNLKLPERRSKPIGPATA